jgi:hypothetical protein
MSEPNRRLRQLAATGKMLMQTDRERTPEYWKTRAERADRRRERAERLLEEIATRFRGERHDGRCIHAQRGGCWKCDWLTRHAALKAESR